MSSPILVKVSSPRQRGRLSAHVANMRPWCSYHQSTGAGVFEVTPAELAQARAARRRGGLRQLRFTVVRNPDDFFPCRSRK